MKFLLEFLVYTLSIGVVAYIIPGVTVESIPALVVFAIILGVINAFVRPVLLVLTLPITIVTLGLFVLVLNAALILFAAWVVPGFTVATFWWALLFSVALWLVHTLLSGLVREEKQ